jgi:hypothetical protein
MNYARLGTLAALHCTGYKPHAARAAVAGTTVVRQVNTVAQSRFQQQLASTRKKAGAIYSD